MEATARDVMTTDFVHVGPDTTVGVLARTLADRRADGALVVDDGELVGVVTTMDLVFREKKVHLPTVLTFMEMVLSLDFRHRTRDEIDKISGTRVADIMSADPFTVTPATALADVATPMVEEHLSMVPVLDGDWVVGVVTRASMVAAIAARLEPSPGLNPPG